jgi:hypothetical protein
LRFENEKDVYPIFSERSIPNLPETIVVSSIKDRLDYFTDGNVRAKVISMLDEIKEWKSGCILLDPKKYSISMKVNNRVFAYLSPRQRHFIIETFSDEDQWKAYPIKTDEELNNIKLTMRAAMEKRV